MKILVTGGAGFIGSHLVDALIEAKHEVLVLDDLSHGYLRWVDTTVPLFNHSLNSDETNYIVKTYKPEVVYHLAASMDIRNGTALQDAQDNIIGSVRLIESCIENGVKKIIYASSGGTVYGRFRYLPINEKHPINPISPYGISKHIIEHYLEWAQSVHGVTYTVLRYANIYGPRQGTSHGNVIPVFTNMLLKGERPTVFGDGVATRDYVYIDDLTEANLLALGGGDNEIYNVGSGVESNVLEILAALCKILGCSFNPKYGELNPTEVPRIALDSRKIKGELGWDVKTPVRDGLREYVRWVKETR